MAEPMRSQTEVVQEYARGCALDLISMLAECEDLDVVSVSANLTGGFPSVSWHGARDGKNVFSTHLVGREVPR